MSKISNRIMKWQKKGLIISPDKKSEWMLTHAQLPCVDIIDKQNYRIYFASRNSENMSQIGYADLNISKPEKILKISKKPILELGDLGTFDDSGVYPSCIVNHDDKKFLYYIGWMQGKRVPYYAAVGLAISEDKGKTFKKFSKGPLFERDNIDPFMTLSSHVIIDKKKWKMWYTSCTGWEIKNKIAWPKYYIKYAESKDGINWKRKDDVSIDFKSKDEWAIARPCVIKDEIYKMWYCYSGEKYRIGYAESKDGINWKRKDDDVGIDVSKSGWDSEMVAYPYVFTNKKQTYMLYNGNQFGKAGIGYAIMEK